MMTMERLSHDLGLALEESDCGPQERRKVGFRRRTRSAGNLPAAVAVSLVEDGSSSSPPQAPLITQPLSDSDEPQIHPHKAGLKPRHYCHIGNFESDSFNENFSPTRPANARRKRKYKKTSVEYVDGRRSPPVEVLNITAECEMPSTSMLAGQLGQGQPKLIASKERNVFCGKRKWSHRDGDGRERSLSGGQASKPAALKHDAKGKSADKKRKETLLQPGKIVLKAPNAGAFPAAPALAPGASFNFVYRNAKQPPTLRPTGYKITTELPPFFTQPKSAFDAKYRRAKMENACFHFDDSGMECVGNESSSLSSSDSDGALNDSDREGDDELTDWPGIEELKVFNKSLTFKSKTAEAKCAASTPPPKRLKKDKPPKASWSCKRLKTRARAGSEDEVMSDAREGDLEDREGATFEDIKNAGGSARNANESFFQSFQQYQQAAAYAPAFGLKPPGPGAEPPGAARAGCRRLRDDRGGRSIHPQPATFTTDLPALETGGLLSKPRSKTQFSQEYARTHLPTDHKRRCYGDDPAAPADDPAPAPAPADDPAPDPAPDTAPLDITDVYVEKSLLDPGSVD